MNVSLVSLVQGVLSGAGFGAIYLGLLWVAVRSLPADRTGVRVFVGLGLARVALLIGALAAAAASGLQAPGFAAAVVGFIAVRFAATRWLEDGSAEDKRWK